MSVQAHSLFCLFPYRLMQNICYTPNSHCSQAVCLLKRPENLSRRSTRRIENSFQTQSKVVPDTQTYHEVLTDFFTSPDVFPYFKDTNTSWSLSEFTDAINSHILDPLLEEMLDAFTRFCHRSGELFYVTAVTRRIKLHTLGWGTCVDQPIGGPSRKTSVPGTKRPRGIDKAESQLCDHADDFDYHPREVTAHELQDKMAYWNRSRLGGLIPRFVVGSMI